jgi:hypothetical protein
MTMFTLGIDLASQPVNTAACLIDWGPARAAVALHAGLDDDALLALMSRADVARVGIDAPFGWPEHFRTTLNAYAREGAWPAGDSVQAMRDLRLRATDLYVQGRTGKWPLSPVAERIGVVAMRCARLLAQMPGPLDRSGRGRQIEVYPAAALSCWLAGERRYGSYKGAGAEREAARSAIVDALTRDLSEQLDMSGVWPGACRRSDHALDAFICAVLARAADCGSLELAPAELQTAAQAEGWICFPRDDVPLAAAVRPGDC